MTPRYEASAARLATMFSIRQLLIKVYRVSDVSSYANAQRGINHEFFHPTFARRNTCYVPRGRPWAARGRPSRVRPGRKEATPEGVPCQKLTTRICNAISTPQARLAQTRLAREPRARSLRRSVSEVSHPVALRTKKTSIRGVNRREYRRSCTGQALSRRQIARP